MINITKMRAAAKLLPDSNKLLRTNSKLEKTFGKAAEYRIAGLTFAPHSLSSTDVCPRSTPACRTVCNLWYAGHRAMLTSRLRALADTMRFQSDPIGFKTLLEKNIEQHKQLAARNQLKPLIRLNVASDLCWLDIISNHTDCQFYDYTKVKSRFRDYLAGKLPSNYFLTYSASERSHGATLRSYLRAGGNVAQVLDIDYYPSCGRIGAMPSEHRYHGEWFPVNDADKHDVRLPIVDGSGTIQGLRLKGDNAAKQRGRDSGFARKPMVRM